jgi:hypothetical protein
MPASKMTLKELLTAIQQLSAPEQEALYSSWTQTVRQPPKSVSSAVQTDAEIDWATYEGKIEPEQLYCFQNEIS